MTILRRADIEAEELPAEFGSPDVDPIDLLLNVAWGLPLVSREERLYRFLHEHRGFLASFQPEARQVLEEMLLKFAEHGSPQLKPETWRFARSQTWEPSSSWRTGSAARRRSMKPSMTWGVASSRPPKRKI